jgi:hypothetical protein
MEEQSDTPRTDAAAQFVSHFGWQVHADFARTLERELATATRERDEARAEVERLRSWVHRCCTDTSGSETRTSSLSL